MTLLFAAFITLAAADVVTYRAGRRELSNWLEIAGMILYASMGLLNVAEGRWLWAAGYGAVLAWWIWSFWRRQKRKRKRTLAALGAKAKARIAAMKRAMRERARPRPVLRPQRSPA